MAASAAGALSPTAGAQADSCLNRDIRAAQGAGHLPDCRAYEQATPVDKGGASIFHYAAIPTAIVGGGLGITAAVSADGNALIFRSILPWASSESGLYQSWIARRPPSGDWARAPLSPATGVEHPRVALETAVDDVNDAYTVFFANTFDRLDPADGVPGSANGYVREPAGAWRLIAPETGTWERGTVYVGSSPDARLAFFESRQNEGVASAKDPAVSMLWSWDRDSGEVEPVSVTDEEQAIDECGGALSGVGRGSNQVSTPFSQAISRDGRRVVFVTPGSGAFGSECGDAEHSRVMVRIDGESTVDASRSRLAVPEAPQPKEFVGADRDVEHVIFKTTERLIEGASPGGGLYRFDVADQSLHYLSPPVSGQAGIGVVRRVSPDGSAIAFEASGDLDQAKPHTTGEMVAFVYSDGETTKLGEPESGPIGTDYQRDSASQVGFSDNGAWLAFTSRRNLTGENATGLDQVYLYDVEGESLVCASCPSGGDEPSASAGLPIETYSTPGGRVPVPRFVTDDGRVYMSAAGRLTQQDVNGRIDVYEFSVTGGLKLISGGAGPEDSALVGISESGDDVFFSTADALVATDVDRGDLDIYTARAGGGIATQNEEPAPSCAGEACRPRDAAPDYDDPGSQTVVPIAPRSADRRRCAALLTASLRSRRGAARLRRSALSLSRRAETAAGKPRRLLRQRSRSANRRAQVQRRKSAALERRANRCRTEGR